MLFATTDAARYSRFLPTPFDFREDIVDHLLTVAARGFHHFFNYAVTIGIQRLKTQLCEFGFNVVDTYPVRQRALNFESFTGDAATFVRAK